MGLYRVTRKVLHTFEMVVEADTATDAIAEAAKAQDADWSEVDEEIQDETAKPTKENA